MWVPAARSVMSWLPLAAVLLSPVPLTVTAVALALDHVIVVAPGARSVRGDALRVAPTAPTAATTIVAVRVTGPPFPCATRV